MVQIKRKVTIKRKTEQIEESAVEKTIVTPNSYPEPAQPNSDTSLIKGKWIVAAVAALLIAGGAYYFSDNGFKEEIEPTTPSTLVESQTDKPNDTNATVSISRGQGSNEELSADKKKDGVYGSEGNRSERNEQQEQKAMEQPKFDEVVRGTTMDPPMSSSIEENAKRVIRGEFGNGQPRKKKLGDKYSEIQNRVNEMYRKGLVK